MLNFCGLLNMVWIPHAWVIVFLSLMLWCCLKWISSEDLNVFDCCGCWMRALGFSSFWKHVMFSCFTLPNVLLYVLHTAIGFSMWILFIHANLFRGSCKFVHAFCFWEPMCILHVTLNLVMCVEANTNAQTCGCIVTHWEAALHCVT